MELYGYNYTRLEKRFKEAINKNKAIIDMLDKLEVIPNKDGSTPKNCTIKNFKIKDAKLDENYSKEYGSNRALYITKQGKEYRITVYRETYSWEENSRQFIKISDEDADISMLIKNFESIKEEIVAQRNQRYACLAEREQQLKDLPKVWKKLEKIELLSLERYHLKELLGY